MEFIRIHKDDVVSLNGREYIVTDIRNDPDRITQYLTLQTKYEPSVDIEVRSTQRTTHWHWYWDDEGCDLVLKDCKCELDRDHTDPNPWE
jgi:hypothetical protein